MKEQAYKFCEEYISSRLQRIKNNIQEIQISLASETKSSAGDKHETGRAMLQLEREKLGQQLKEAEKTKAILEKVFIKKKNDVISVGSLFITDKYCYYIAISAGLVELDQQKVFCVSAQTPIAKQALGKSVGDSFIINGVEQRIASVH